MQLQDLRIGIVGLGQIGGSIAWGLKEAIPQLSLEGFDLRRELVIEAHRRRLIRSRLSSINQLLGRIDVVILALPIRQIIDVIRDQADMLARKKLVTDTGSLKESVTREAARCGLNNFVGGHPLAGSEKRGTESWNARLFEGACYFLTQQTNDNNESLDWANQLVRVLKAKAVFVDTSEHDRIFSTTNNLPHLFAFLLRRQFDDLNGASNNKQLYRCPSFEGATRVAASEPEMVFQMLWYNRSYLRTSLSSMIAALQEAQEALDRGEEKQFRRLFDLATGE